MLARHLEVEPHLGEPVAELRGQVGRQPLDGQRRAPMNMPFNAS